MSSLLRTDEELIQIYNRHVNTVYRVCFLYMKNKADTEDMVQNTFLRLMKSNVVFENAEHEKAWLIRTAINLCKGSFQNLVVQNHRFGPGAGKSGASGF